MIQPLDVQDVTTVQVSYGQGTALLEDVLGFQRYQGRFVRQALADWPLLLAPVSVATATGGDVHSEGVPGGYVVVNYLCKGEGSKEIYRSIDTHTTTCT